VSVKAFLAGLNVIRCGVGEIMAVVGLMFFLEKSSLLLLRSRRYCRKCVAPCCSDPLASLYRIGDVKYASAFIILSLSRIRLASVAIVVRVIAVCCTHGFQQWLSRQVPCKGLIDPSVLRSGNTHIRCPVGTEFRRPKMVYVTVTTVVIIPIDSRFRKDHPVHPKNLGRAARLAAAVHRTR